MLASVLTALKKEFVLRVNAEKSPRGVNEDVYLDDDGSDQAEEGTEEEVKEEEDAFADISNGVEGTGAHTMWHYQLVLYKCSCLQVLLHPTSEKLKFAGLSGAEAPERRQPLTKEMQRSFAKVIVQLASTAQYSKASLAFLQLDNFCT